ncbi:hypothetical protein B0H13DRAFT_2382522 [Mycena leptocephala]|nr:hypothetical protein B0H13DRAFT_2382522 [Mycena leptocephala]
MTARDLVEGRNGLTPLSHSVFPHEPGANESTDVRGRARQGPATTSDLGLRDLIGVEIGGASVGVVPNSIGDGQESRRRKTGKSGRIRREELTRSLAAFTVNEVERLRERRTTH